MRRCVKICEFSHRSMRHNFRVCKFENSIICGKYAIYGFCNICDRMCDRMFLYNRNPYNCASVQRALLAPEILSESFVKCRYFTALLSPLISMAATAARRCTHRLQLYVRLRTCLRAQIELGFGWGSCRRSGMTYGPT